jgi:DNA (cytosine-5)-methyltransferase 1
MVQKIGVDLVAAFSSLEICAGAGGQALGLERAGFDHVALVENDGHAVATLRHNRPHWNALAQDLVGFVGTRYRGIDLLAGGVPCPPFSKAGHQLGSADERNLFPAALRLVDEIRPRAVMFENVRGLLDPVFASYRADIEAQMRALDYTPLGWHLLNASNFGVPQLRPRVVFVAIRRALADGFAMPQSAVSPKTVGETLVDLMAERGWSGAVQWAAAANQIAPTVVGGSKKHGGPDLGPTRARKAWAALGVDGLGIANEAPGPDFAGMPRLTVRMVARLQGFPDDWQFVGGKTASYRQVGNAFPPPVAEAVARAIAKTLEARRLVSLSA